MLHQPVSAEEKPPLALLEISRDAREFNRIANHPSVHPHVMATGPIDLTDLLADDYNVGFLGEDCAFLAHCHEPGVFEVHSMALPSARGRHVYDCAMAAIRCMFVATPARELLTRVAVDNLAALALTRKVGFALDFERAIAWDGKPVRYFALRYPDWVRRQTWLEASGRWFHDLLGEQSHDEDPAHDLHVGACVEMVKAGNADKGVILYNRWARFAGYAPIEIVSYEPLVLDIHTHLITVSNGNVEVRPCP